ncbi:hypothetical protein L916_07184 [Phytophthora nicotianae]|uniref:Transposase Tc1-like domain-containing protein n=1 Tax=Phytophthora nicotianae TaxID=4792 RepID=W2J6C0_PHYNI|nr:hypothetical protein L916_07184 [Phytophthora nicotianae]
MTVLALPDPTKRKNLTPKERAYALSLMYGVTTNMTVPAKTYARVSALLGCSGRQICRLWKKARDAVKNGKLCDVESGRKGRCGRKSRVEGEFPRELAVKIALTPLHLRTNLRTLAEQLGIAISTLHVYLQSGLFRSHHARLKQLTDEQRVARMNFALKFVEPSARGRHEFESLLDYVHLDEKLFS